MFIIPDLESVMAVTHVPDRARDVYDMLVASLDNAIRQCGD